MKNYDFTELETNLQNLECMNDLDDSNYTRCLFQWLNEIVIKNRIIFSCRQNHSDRDVELVSRKRGHIYWTNFGMNIGAEFSGWHWCLVIREFARTALVVPLSSVKASNQEWKKASNCIVDIGKIRDLPKDNSKNIYALVNQMRSISKQRLSPYRDRDSKRIYSNIKVSAEQLDLVDSVLISLAKDATYLKESFSNDYY